MLTTRTAFKIKLEGEQGDHGARDKITPMCLLLEDPEDPRLPPADAETASKRMKFDLITSHLVLHHVADVRALLVTMLGCLRPGTGEVALTDYADFGPDARRFHPEARMVGVEHERGIGAEWLAGLMREVGFVDVEVEGRAWVMDKEVERWPGEWGGMEEGQEMRRPVEGAEVLGFPFLLARGRRGG